jgi:endonuclease/exonuclease/phosphatase family metal-dependent hydrolase
VVAAVAEGRLGPSAVVLGDADVIGLQELRRWPRQIEWITRRLNEMLGADPPYRYHAKGKTGPWGLWEGIAVLTRLPLVERGWLDLQGEHRMANWSGFARRGGH